MGSSKSRQEIDAGEYFLVHIFNKTSNSISTKGQTKMPLQLITNVIFHSFSLQNIFTLAAVKTIISSYVETITFHVNTPLY